MKKKVIFLLYASIFLLSFGQSVTLDEAQRAAINHSHRITHNTTEVETILPIMSGGKVCLYQITLTDGSWCYVSADKRITPILAYGTSTDFYDDIPDAFIDLLDWYVDQVDDIDNYERDSVADNSFWDTLLFPARAYPEEYTLGTGMLNTTGKGDMKWRQKKNNDDGCTPSYNQDCPIGLLDCDCFHTPVGCGAVAMGMVMWYWQWPKCYQWNLMPSALYNTTPEAQANTVSEFLRYCGDLSGMSYSCLGSSTIGPNIKSALHGFGYTSARVYDKDDWWPWAWRCLLLSEIDNKRPVIYYGQSSNINFTSGHFFVIDGYKYNPDLMFHVNFGHGSPEAWCTLTDILEIGLTDTHNYSYQNTAIIGISPQYNETEITQVCYNQIQSYDWRTEYASSFIHIPAINELLTIEFGGRLFLEAGSEIVLQPGFEAKLGSEVTACINEGLIDQMDISWSLLQGSVQTGGDLTICTQNADSWEFKVKSGSSYVYQGAGSINEDCTTIWENISIPVGRYRANLVLKNSYGKRLESSINIDITRGDSLAISIESSNVDSEDIDYENQTEPNRETSAFQHNSIFQDSLYPNPTSWEVTVSVDGEVQAIVIYNAMGQPVGGWKLQAVEGDVAILDVSSLPTGNYLLTVRTTDNIVTKKLVVQRR